MLASSLLATGSSIQIVADSVVLRASAPEAVSLYDGTLNLGIGAGLLLTSGYVPGISNTVGWDGADNSGSTGFDNGDADIDAVVNTVFQTQSYDATTLSFDFTVSDPNATSVSFDLVFGSEEFPEWVDQFVDCAVVMVNGVNYALFNHDPNHPLSVVSPNLAAGYFQDNANGALQIEYDGVSQVLKVVAPILSGGATNHIKIGIADTGDHIYDSGIFIANLAAGYIPGSGVVSPSGNTCTDSADSLTGSAKDEYFDLKGGDDVAYAGAGDDIVVAGAGNDRVYGGSGADQIEGDSGDDAIDGGDGLDTAVYAGNRADYEASALGAQVLVVANPSAAFADGTDTLSGIEFLKFKDGLYKLTAGATLELVPGGGTVASANSPGAAFVSGIGAAGQTLTATVSDPDGVSGAVTFQWQSSLNGDTWTDVGAGENVYTVAAGDAGSLLRVVATYQDGGAVQESPVSAPKAIIALASGDLKVTLMQLDAPAGASVIDPLTTLVQDAIAFGVSPNVAAQDIKTVLGLPADLKLQSYDAFAALLATPGDATALKVEKVAVQVAVLTSLSDDDTGVCLTSMILSAAGEGRVLNLANVADLGWILGIDPVKDPLTNKYPEPLNEIQDRNRNIAEAGSLAGIEKEWQDLLSIQDGIKSKSIADLSVHVNQAPEGYASATLADGAADTDYTLSAAQLLNGFIDPEGSTLTVADLLADHGVVATADGLTFTITPEAGFNGPVELTYQVWDADGGWVAANQLFVVAPVVIEPVNHAPEGSATAVLAGCAEDASLTLSLADLVAGFSDADGDALAVEGLTATDATVVYNGDGTYTITPASNYNGPVTLAYAVSDGKGGSLAATQVFDVSPVNDAPTGTVTINGIAKQGQVLQATQALADVDGIPTSGPGAIGFQWLANGTVIAGAQGATFTLSAAEIGKAISVKASYTDAMGTAESMESAATAKVVAVTGLSVSGTSGADSIVGDAGNDTLSGQGGNDTITGFAGDDVINGGAGTDRLDGGDGSDIYVVALASDHLAGEFFDSGALGSDEVRFSATKAATLTLYAADVGVERVVIGTGTASSAVSTGTTALNVNASAVANALSITGNAGANSLTGTAFNDVLAGGAGADSLLGGAGADILYGGNGNDVLTGGSGADRFVFDVAPNASTNKDTLTDFVSGTDALQFSLAVFTKLGGVPGGLAPAQFWSASGATSGHDADDRFVYNTKTGAMYYDADGNGSGAAIQVALVGTVVHPVVSYADIQLIA